MAVTHFLQDLWSAKIQKGVERETKLVQLCNQKYEGDVEYGKTVKILAAGDPVIAKYTGTITTNEMTDDGVILAIDQANYFSFYVDDINKAQSVPGLPEKYQEKAVHGLAVKRDEYVGGIAAAGTNKLAKIDTPTADTMAAGIDEGIVALQLRDVNGKLSIALDPKGANLMKNYIIKVSTDNIKALHRGVIGMYGDAEVVMSNSIKRATNVASGFICTKDAMAFAGQINKVESLRAENKFADIVRGLDTFGAKVIDEKQLQVVEYDVKTEDISV